jgi:hypothetical protein
MPFRRSSKNPVPTPLADAAGLNDVDVARNVAHKTHRHQAETLHELAKKLNLPFVPFPEEGCACGVDFDEIPGKDDEC